MNPTASEYSAWFLRDVDLPVQPSASLILVVNEPKLYFPRSHFRALQAAIIKIVRARGKLRGDEAKEIQANVLKAVQIATNDSSSGGPWAHLLRATCTLVFASAFGQGFPDDLLEGLDRDHSEAVRGAIDDLIVTLDSAAAKSGALGSVTRLIYREYSRFVAACSDELEWDETFVKSLGVERINTLESPDIVTAKAGRKVSRKPRFRQPPAASRIDGLRHVFCGDVGIWTGAGSLRAGLLVVSIVAASYGAYASQTARANIDRDLTELAPLLTTKEIQWSSED
jgi:hypothetical protein